jgi:hypothetical protein
LHLFTCAQGIGRKVNALYRLEYDRRPNIVPRFRLVIQAASWPAFNTSINPDIFAGYNTENGPDSGAGLLTQRSLGTTVTRARTVIVVNGYVFEILADLASAPESMTVTVRADG